MAVRRKVPPGNIRRSFKVTQESFLALEISRRQKAAAGIKAAEDIFKPAEHPPGVGHNGVPEMAMDDAMSAGAWAGSVLSSALSEGQGFLGYPYLAELAQRPEYRRAVEIIAWEMTRKWIKFTATGDDDKSEKLKKIEAAFQTLRVKRAFRQAAAVDGFFGRAHIFLDFGAKDNAELSKTIGDGNEQRSKAKVGLGSLKGLKVIEAMWAYPMDYNANNPLASNWYSPETWGVMGTNVHATRLLTFVGRPVPDILKPAYSFGGLALTQMMKPYVDIWLQTRQSVADLVRAFSTMVLATNMAGTTGAVGQTLFDRVAFFNQFRSNEAAMVIDKDTEDLKNVSAPLSGLDALQQQALEHICSATGEPLVKYTGISPSGLNASSEGELRVWYDNVLAWQEAMFEEPLERLLRFVQLSLFGEVDPEIGFAFIPLWEMSEKEKAEIRKANAETGQILVDGGAISPDEERRRVIDDEDSPYAGLDPDESPTPEEQEAILSVKGHPTHPEDEEQGDGDLDHLPWQEGGRRGQIQSGGNSRLFAGNGAGRVEAEEARRA